MTTAEAYAHCREIARTEARNFYYGFRLLDSRRRDAIHAVYAFSRRVDDSVDGAEPLDWKLAELTRRRAELAACVAGAPSAGDPISVALSAAIREFHIPPARLHEIVDGVEMDLTVDRYESFDDLLPYCDRVAGAVGVVSLHIFGFDDPAAVGHAEDLGVAMQLVNIMRDVSEDAQRGRIYLPLADLRAHGVAEADLLAERPTTGFRALMRAEGARAHAYFDRGNRLLPLLDRRSRMCVATMAGLYEAILVEIERRDYDVLAGRIGLSSQRKLGLMARGILSGLGRR